MPHPNGGSGNTFTTIHSFAQAFARVGNGLTFISTTGETIRANQGTTEDGVIPTIVFVGENSRHGNVCEACWGYRNNCSGTNIGQCVEALGNA